jgi:predicted amidohydrolase
MKVALVQLTSSNDPAHNLLRTEGFIREAAANGAAFVLTPETTNIISSSRKQQTQVLHTEADDPSLARLRNLAEELKIWLLIGSLGLKTGDADGRFANRSLLVSPTGELLHATTKSTCLMSIWATARFIVNLQPIVRASRRRWPKLASAKSA